MFVWNVIRRFKMFDLSEVEKEVLLMGNLKSALADGDLDTQEQAVELVDRN
jgi:hypothetical protein